jgi:hypothetical protein
MQVGNSVVAFSLVLTSIGLTLTGFSIYWWRKGYASFSQPGQMLLLQYAATLMLTLMSLGIALAMSGAGISGRSRGGLSYWPLLMGINGLLFGVLLPVVFYVWCAWKIADTWPWRLLFLMCALSAILTSILIPVLLQYVNSTGPGGIRSVIGIPQLIRGALLLGVGVLAIVTDLAAKRRRSWTHWAGIILWLLGQTSSFLMGLYYLLFWPMA